MLNPLVEAALDNDFARIARNMEYVGQQTVDGLSSLMVAARQGCVEGVLLLANQEVGLQDAQGNSALMHAVRGGCAEAVRVLAKAEAGLVNKNGETAL